jgi:hypothetical protein
MVLLATALLTISVATTVELAPTDDVWVYPHASDPGKDPFMRVWGGNDLAVSPSPDEMDSYSYGYLKFDLSSLNKGQKLTAAELVLKHAADPGFSQQDADNRPIQARALLGTFEEKTWQYENATKVAPDKSDTAVYGSATGTVISNGQPFTLTIDLLKGPAKFAERLETGSTLALALTSTIDPQVGGMRAVYKVYSKDAENESNRPKLRLTFE